MPTLRNFLAATALLLCITSLPSWAGRSLCSLTCEQLPTPVGMDSERPRICWKISSDRRHQVTPKRTDCQPNNKTTKRQNH
ncbi:MAG: hypothetical protein Q4E63_08425 [Prevotellaceae bacterium]|nr:hypothetical protein [Prevotellaceae bacterium]